MPGNLMLSRRPQMQLSVTGDLLAGPGTRKPDAMMWLSRSHSRSFGFHDSDPAIFVSTVV